MKQISIWTGCVCAFSKFPLPRILTFRNYAPIFIFYFLRKVPDFFFSIEVLPPFKYFRSNKLVIASQWHFILRKIACIYVGGEEKFCSFWQWAVQELFMSEFMRHVGSYQQTSYSESTASLWLSLRLQVCFLLHYGSDHSLISLLFWIRAFFL